MEGKAGTARRLTPAHLGGPWVPPRRSRAPAGPRGPSGSSGPAPHTQLHTVPNSHGPMYTALGEMSTLTARLRIVSRTHTHTALGRILADLCGSRAHTECPVPSGRSRGLSPHPSGRVGPRSETNLRHNPSRSPGRRVGTRWIPDAGHSPSTSSQASKHFYKTGDYVSHSTNRTH